MSLPRSPAHNSYAEECLLACLMLDADLLAALSPPIDEEDFHVERFRCVYRIIRGISGSGLRPDGPAVAEQLALLGLPGVVDAVRFVEGVLQSVADVKTGRYYAEILREKRIEREIFACHDRAQAKT